MKMLRLKLLKKWGPFGAGSVVDFGEEKGRPLIANGIAEEVGKNEKILKIRDGNSLIRLKLLKQWGPYGAGSIVDFGESKGRPLITNGTAEEVSRRERKVEVKISKKKKPELEVAMVNPAAETAEVTPEIKTRRGRPKNKKE